MDGFWKTILIIWCGNSRILGFIWLIKRLRTKSSLVGHVWDLKDNQTDFEVTWKKLDYAQPYNSVTKKCRLCLREKFFIMYRKDDSSLNKRSEVFNTCRHRNKTLLSVIKWKCGISFWFRSVYVIVKFLFKFCICFVLGQLKHLKIVSFQDIWNKCLVLKT